MRSIDNLRERANGLHGVYINQADHTITVTTGWDAPPDMDSVSLRDHVNGILDGIEREVGDMVPLPVDADGVPIHVGETVTCVLPFGGESKPFVVDRMELGRDGDGDVWSVALDRPTSCWEQPLLLRHHHAPTVEDVLAEMLDVWGESPSNVTNEAIIAEYAAKLRLVGDE